MDSADSFLPKSAPRLGKLARLGLQHLMYWTGAGYLLSKTARTSAVILAYHSIAEDHDAEQIDPRTRISPAEFTLQMEFLARHRRVISISELASSIEEGRPLKPGTVVLTFDDGYRDNIDVAAPILRRLGLPAIIYLPTALISSGERPWADQLYSMFRLRRENSLDAVDGRSRSFDLDSEVGCREAFVHASDLLIAAEQTSRKEILATIKRQLDPKTFKSPQPLDWEQLRQMRNDFPLVEIGLHSDTHIDLTAYDLAVVEEELRRCQETYQRELGTEAKHFAFPYDRHNADICRLVADKGFVTAVSTSKNCEVNSNSNPMALPRIPPPDSMTLFRLWTQGAIQSLKLANRS